ncbi:MAG: phage tail protein [Cyanobacteriota bacterium]
MAYCPATWMPHNPVLYENLPVNARLADERGVLRHVCDAVQPTYSDILATLARLEFLFDPDSTPVEFLDWFQQIVALAPVGDRTLGLGLDPDWPAEHKRDVIKRAWRYWQTKGTEIGIREAIALWLRWEDAKTEPAVLIRLPWGKEPAATPPQWWGYSTRYDAWPTQTWDERQFLGSGDYPQRYAPDWNIIQSDQNPWDYTDKFDQHFVERDVAIINSPGSLLGPHAIWEHLTPGEIRWNKVFPAIEVLNQESWDIQARIGVFGWIDGGETEAIVAQRSPTTIQTETRYDVEIIGFRYTDVLPFRGVETEPARQNVAADEFIAENLLPLVTARQNLAINAITVDSSFATTPDTAPQTLDASSMVVRDILAIARADQTLAPDAIAVESIFTTDLRTAEQAIASDRWTARNLLAPDTAPQNLDASGVVVRDILAIARTDQTLLSDAVAIESVFTTDFRTAEQTVAADIFAAQIYDWFYQNIVL